MFVIWLLAVGSGFIMPLAITETWATTMYSYVDEHGTPVITDNFNTIPERYRARVKTTEQVSSASQNTSTAGAIHKRVTSWEDRLKGLVPSSVPGISGLSPSQSQILTYAGIAAIILIIAMYMSKGQSIRLLALWLLIMLGLGTPVLMYVSKDGPMDALKAKAAQAEKQHQSRAEQIP
jgi:hypothetical protein